MTQDERWNNTGSRLTFGSGFMINDYFNRAPLTVRGSGVGSLVRF